MSSNITLNSFNDNINKLKDRYKDNQKFLYTIFFWLSMLFAIISVVYRFVVTKNLNDKSDSLYKTSIHNLNGLNKDDSIKDIFPLRKDLWDMLWFDTQILTNIENTKIQRQRLSMPFENFLHMFYVPSIDIWRDPFSGIIDTTLIGKKYIENNPYGDIALIEQRTSFFKDVWVVDSYNTINDIRIGKIDSSDTVWYFSIPITVEFETPDKRSFLLLVNKLSMTAYIQNLSLINEFMYYVRETIKETKVDILQQYENNENIKKTDENYNDKIIWYLLYDRIVKWGENKLITQDVIAQAIRKTAWCTTEEQWECMYLFREKMRAIPYLAYGVGREGIDTVEWFKFFFNNMPPILSIEKFSFEEKSKQKTSGWGYKWSISIRIYWKDVVPEEIDNISNELWAMCFISKKPISVATAKSITEKAINDLWWQTLNTKRSLTLTQILWVVNSIESEYETLSNHRKVVRLFELYRTLRENDLCDIVNTGEQSVQEPVISDVSDLIPFVPSGVDTVVVDNNTWISLSWDIPIFTSWDVIGDGNSKRDTQIMNELEWLQ